MIVKSLVWLSFGTALMLVGQMSLITYVPLYLKETRGISHTGRARHWPPRNWAERSDASVGESWRRLFHGARKSVLVLIGILSVTLTASLGLLPSDSSLFILLPLIFFAGVCMVGYQGVYYALIGEIAGKARTGAALGLVITVNRWERSSARRSSVRVDVTGSYTIAWEGSPRPFSWALRRSGFFSKSRRAIVGGRGRP